MADLPPPPPTRRARPAEPPGGTPSDKLRVREEWERAAADKLEEPELEPEPVRELQANLEPVEHASREEPSARPTAFSSGEEDLPLELDRPKVPTSLPAPTVDVSKELERAPSRELATGPRPSPSPGPAGGGDFLAQVLIVTAIGLLLTIYPARWFADRFGQRGVEPLLAELEEAIERPLAVDGGELREPSVVRSEIAAYRGRVRTRYFAYWLVGALPIALGLTVLVRRRA